MFKINVVSGLVSDIVRWAPNSAEASSPATPSNFLFSYSVFESAFITLMPLIFSCTERTILSPLRCTRIYIGTLLRVINQIAAPTNGTVASSTSASLASRRKQNISPPRRSMGARTPRRIVRATIWFT